MLLLNLNLLATAPGGVARLRELILTLAVQGKLVPQDPTDEPASKLLKKIRAEKDRLISDKKIRRSKPLDTINDSECSFVLPGSWEWERLGNLGDWGAGATPSRTNSNYYGGQIPWFKSGELTADFISESEETVTDAALCECSLRLNQVGDVLIAMYGATIGKTAILSIVATTNQAVCACTPFAGLTNTYLLLLMKALKPYFISIGEGGAQPNISREKVVATVVGLPPLAEQSRIVTRVEELMRLCDALEAKGQLQATQHAQLVSTLLGTLTQSETPEQLAENWHRIATHFDLLLDRPQAIDALEQTIFGLAMRGLLVAQDSSDESATEVLKRIARRQKNPVKSIESASGANEEVPFSLPTSWAWCNVAQIATVGLGGTPARHESSYWNGTIPWVSSGEVANGRISDTKEKITQAGLANSNAKVYPKNTVLIAMIGQGKTRGQSALLDIEACTNQNVAGLVLEQGAANPDYIFLWARHEYVRTRSGGRGGAQPALNGAIVRSLKVPLPPLAEQFRIITRVAQLRRLCADLRQRLSVGQITQAQLAEALIEEVFSS